MLRASTAIACIFVFAILFFMVWVERISQEAFSATENAAIDMETVIWSVITKESIELVLLMSYMWVMRPRQWPAFFTVNVPNTT